MTELKKNFNERVEDLKKYIEFLEKIEDQIKNSKKGLGFNNDILRLLIANVYLILYNLIESTINKCLESISMEIKNDRCHPSKLSEKLHYEWIKSTAKLDYNLNKENQINLLKDMFSNLSNTQYVADFDIQKGGGGNWDDEEIFKLASRIGVSLDLDGDLSKKIKGPTKNEKGLIKKIVEFRNKLAHGNISFKEAGEATVSDMKEKADNTIKYLEEVISCFESFITSKNYLIP